MAVCARHNLSPDRWAIVLLAALALAFWGNCVWGGRVPVAAIYQKQMLPWSAVAAATGETRQWDSLLWDSMAQFYPWRLLLHRAAQSGELPLWNPYQFCGYPFVGNGQSALFYPPNWLYFVVHPKWGMGVSAALHFFLGGLFVFGLARGWRLAVLPALFAALAFTYGGFMVTWVELPTLPNSLIWLPLAWWGVELIMRPQAIPLSGARVYRARERGRGEDAFPPSPERSRTARERGARDEADRAVGGVLMLAAALGLTLLAGHFQIAAYVWIFTLLYAIIRLCTSGAALSSSAGLQPARGEPEPDVLGGLEARTTGEGGRLEACTARRRRRLCGRLLVAAVLGLLLATAQLLPTLELGQHSSRGVGGPTAAGFAFHRQRALQPIELATLLAPDFFGSPVTGDYPGLSYSEHCGFVGAITLLLGLAGLGLRPRRGMAWLFGGLALFALWGAMAGPPALLLYWGVPKLGQAGGFARLLSVWTLAAALWGATGLQAIMDRGLKPPAGGNRPADGRLSTAVAAVALALLLVQVLPWAYRFNPRARAEDVYPETELVRQLRQRLGSGRYVALNDRQAWGLTKVPASVVLPPNAATVYGLRCVDGYDSLFPLRYRQFAAQVEGADPSPLANGNMLLFAEATTWMREPASLAVQAAPASLPEACGTVWSGEGCAIARRTLQGWPRLYVALQMPLRTVPVTPSREGLNMVRLPLPDSQPYAPLIVADALDGGWRAVADGGEQLPLQPGPRASAMVPVPPGVRRIDLVYFPASVVCGLFVSLLALAALVGLAAYGKAGRGR